jgi:hypothetical protein
LAKRRSFRYLVTVTCLAVVVVSPVAADDLAFLIEGLYGTIILDNPGHAAHFSSADQLDTVNTAFIGALLPELSTFPLGSPGGGLTFVYDEELGTFSRAGTSFGSLFSERALTIGDGKWDLGVSYQSLDYENLGDFDLGSGDLEFQLAHVEETGLFFEGDVIDSRTTINLSTDTTVVFFAYGVNDRLDVTVAIPFVQVDLSVAALLTINRLSTSTIPGIHGFSQAASPELQVLSRDQAIASDSGSSSGIGDVLLRGKYRFADAPGGGMALALDLRLATGNELELLGTGGTQARLFLVGSREWGAFAPHFNVGYTFSGVGGQALEVLPNEIGATLGFGIAAGSRVTLSADVLARRLLDAPALESVDREFEFSDAQGNEDTVVLPDLDATVANDLDLVLGSAGLRWNPAGSFLVSFSALYTLSSDGLEDEDVIPVVALDYSF